MSDTVTSTSLPLKLIARGKVRDVYDAGLSSDHEHAGALLFIATDRISAFDVILDTGIPGKGQLLHALSTFWFKLLTPHILPSHVIATDFEDFPQQLKESLKGHEDQVKGRSMLVKRATVLPIEAIVRGYITGSGWKEYKEKGTVHGIKLQPGLVESQKLPDGPLFTPSTKAEQGAHDENIHPDKVAELVGEPLAKAVEKAALQLYQKAAEHALSRGVILADTKFEFGIIPSDDNAASDPATPAEYKGTLILVDEVLTPDSSRFWAADGYTPGQGQDSFDKQFVRDYLISNGLDKKAKEEGAENLHIELPADVVKRTAEKYKEALDRLIGSDSQKQT